MWTSKQFTMRPNTLLWQLKYSGKPSYTDTKHGSSKQNQGNKTWRTAWNACPRYWAFAWVIIWLTKRSKYDPNNLQPHQWYTKDACTGSAKPWCSHLLDLPTKHYCGHHVVEQGEGWPRTNWHQTVGRVFQMEWRQDANCCSIQM